MFQSKWGKALIVAVLSLSLSHIPEIAFAATAEQMISTMDVVESLSREQTEARIQSYLDRSDVQTELSKMGLSPSELSARVATLSDSELASLSKQMDEARYGGDVVGILVVVLLVVLIIYLAKRI